MFGGNIYNALISCNIGEASASDGAAVGVISSLRRNLMKNLISAIKGFFWDEEGATAVEYGIMVALIAAAIVIIVYFVGQQVKQAFTDVCNAMANVTNMACKS